MVSSSECNDCTFCVFMLLGLVLLIGGIITMIMSEGQMWIAAIAIFAISLIFFFMGNKRRTSLTATTKVIGIARGHSRISMEELSNLSRVPLDNARDIIYSGIASGTLRGTLEGNIFTRSESPTSTGGVRTIEREVMVTRKVPEKCYSCGASIDPKEVEWVGPDSVKCTHCGAVLAVKTERL
jgi:hypothetical protein